ncbi:ligand-binding sensor domain-containing protein [Paraflavitalea speifideaquila]|uniref:ligand-binding sensor domain-containing protein n=1 Tax=Paraflavitalea speifideaquila TaxID=3076558 RepID=UPI0028E3F022|nr:two-component regulator propeller domain-containing protein [Paraflavitalea speifideiaquila]
MDNTPIQDTQKGRNEVVVTSIVEDREHNFWLGTSGGLYVCNPDRQKITVQRLIPASTGQPADGDITAFLQLGNGNIWVASWEHFITTYDSTLKRTGSLPLPATKDDNYWRPWCLLETSKGDILVGCQLGRLLIKRAGKTQFVCLRPDAFDERTIRTMTEDREGNIWFGTQHGVIVKWDLHTNQFLRFTDSLYPAREVWGNIYKLLTDRQGQLWMATNNSGLLKINKRNGAVMAVYKAQDTGSAAITANSVADILEYDDSTLVLATSFGINIFNKRHNTFQAITTLDGLPENSIVSVQKDKNGNLWAGSGVGLIKVTWQSRKINTYGLKDGIVNSAFNATVAYRLHNNNLLAGSSSDFICFHPDSLAGPQVPPDVRITGFKVFNKHWIIDSLLEQHRPVRLSYMQNFITISFASLGYTDKGISLIIFNWRALIRTGSMQATGILLPIPICRAGITPSK